MTGAEKDQHKGTDYAAPRNTPVRAMFDGEVTYAGNQGGNTGFIVKVKDKLGREVKYMHLEPGSLKVEKGQKIKAGHHVAGVGKTGRGTGYHLHAELWIDGNPVDLEKYLKDQSNA